jgi:glutamate dehydrogenase (NADP+)
MRNEFTGVLTGKGLNWGGSLIRPEATGYGAVYFAAEMLATRGETLKGKTCIISGSGNVAQFTGGKADQSRRAARHVVRLERFHLRLLRHRSRETAVRVRTEERAPRPHPGICGQVQGVTYTPIDPKADFNPLWDVKADCAFPSATQNEINAKDAANLLKNGIYVISEGANMPTALDGVQQFVDAKILYAPGKAVERRRRRDVRPRNDAEQPAHDLGLATKSTNGCRPIMKSIPQELLGHGRVLRHARNYVNGAEYRGLHEGRRRDDGSGCGVRPCLMRGGSERDPGCTDSRIWRAIASMTSCSSPVSTTRSS